MAAGLGFKDFQTGEVLTAADVDGYLMQGVWVFASAAARDAAVTSPQEGNFAYLKDTNVTTYYTGSAWANLDTTGMTNPMTTTGDTIYSSSGSTPARLGIGSTGQVLTVAGGVPSWASPASTASGLNLVKTQTIGSAVTSVTVSDAFSTTYENYLVTINGGVGSTANRMEMQLGASSTGYYATGQSISYSAGTLATRRDDNNTAWTYAGTYSTDAINAQMWLGNPFLAKKTTIRNNITYVASGEGAGYMEGFHNVATSYTAFTIFALGGATLTGGTIRVYGLKDTV